MCTWLSQSQLCSAIGVHHIEFASELAGVRICGSEVEHASGPWFGDTSLGNLTVVDTPGFHDTAGESMDAMNWAKTVAAIRRLRAVDAIVLVVERTFRADTFAEQAIRQLRASFGIEIWRLCVCGPQPAVYCGRASLGRDAALWLMFVVTRGGGSSR